MSRTKLRKITVADTHYLWQATPVNPNYLLVKVWLSGPEHRNSPLCVSCRFDDPWLHAGEIWTSGGQGLENFQFTPLKPAEVREIIEKALSNGWVPGHNQPHHSWERDTRKLVATENATLPE